MSTSEDPHDFGKALADAHPSSSVPADPSDGLPTSPVTTVDFNGDNALVESIPNADDDA